MTKTRPAVICLMGPTATGKTELALALADRLPVELISVDSALVYRGLDIGTAKPSPTILQQYPHHLIDILDPSESYSAAAFRQDALHQIDAIAQRGRVPLLVGGTMLYFRALLHGLSPLPPAQTAIRQQLQQRLQQHGLAALHAELQRVDPELAQTLRDPQRILRALEVHQITGEPMSRIIARDSGTGLQATIIKFALLPEDRSVLHQRIAERLQTMLDDGFVEEVAELKARGDLTPQLPALRTVGYRQIWAYLDGALEYAEMRQQAIIATRQLAKRQLTWLRRERDIHNLSMLNYAIDAVSAQIEAFLGAAQR